MEKFICDLNCGKNFNPNYPGIDPTFQSPMPNRKHVLKWKTLFEKDEKWLRNKCTNVTTN